MATFKFIRVTVIGVNGGQDIDGRLVNLRRIDIIDGKGNGKFTRIKMEDGEEFYVKNELDEIQQQILFG